MEERGKEPWRILTDLPVRTNTDELSVPQFQKDAKKVNSRVRSRLDIQDEAVLASLG